ncbi:MAG TPA: VCBS domain-containing protein [Pseudoduganella sp.]
MSTITGSNGSDTLIGTIGSDIINSGNGDDIVNGSAGSDQVNGGAGSDTLIYTVSENLGGYKDVYTGGSGIDTVRLQLSFEQWNDPTVRWELERYVKFLSTVRMNTQGEVSNGSASDFVFNFGTSTLTVQMMETLAVWVQPESGGDYAQVDYLTSLISGDAGGSVVEAGGVGNSDPGSPTVTGQLKSDDLNGVDNLFQAVDAGKAAKYGSYSVSANGEWKYTLNNADSRVQELAANDTLSDSFTVSSADGAVKVITIMIVGSNDAPVVSGAITSTAAEGSAPYSLNLLAGASDADHGETATLSVTGVNYRVDGVAVSGVPAGVSLTGGTLSVDPGNGAFDHLAVGEHSTIVVSYYVKDAQGATVAQSATITIDGTNDVPAVAGALSLGEDEGEGLYALNLLDGASDLDNGETASLSVADVTYSVDDGEPSADAPEGVSLVGNKLNVDPLNGAFNHLAINEQTTIVVSYNVKDVHGATVAQVATITINGTNDTPQVSGELTSSAAEGAQPYTINLLDGASDVDNGETASLSVADVTYSVNDGEPSADAPEGVSLIANKLNVDPLSGAFSHLAVGEQLTIVVNYNVKDVHGATAAQVATITINGTNDSPQVSGELALSATEGAQPYTINLLDGASDVDHDETATLTVVNVGYSIDGSPVSSLTPVGVSLAGSTLTVDPSNSGFNYLTVGSHATITVSFDVRDAYGAVAPQVAKITINGTNDTPVISGALTSTAAEGAGAYAMNLLAGASDSDDGETATLSIANVSYGVDGGPVSSTAPAGVNLTGSTLSVDPANGSFDHLAAGENSTIVVSYSVKDAQGATVTQSATITITGENDAPVLNMAASPVMTNVIEDAGAPSGAVGTLVSSLVNLNPPLGGLDNVTDVDTGALAGIALTGTNASSGTWWYSTNGGANWSMVGTVSNSSALLLSADANTRIYFQGNLDFNGTVSDGVTFRAWDRTSGTAGTKVSTTTNGGNSAFSAITDTASIAVDDDNYAPVPAGDRIIVSSGTNVTLATSALLANDIDIDGSALTITSVSSAFGISNLILTSNGITFKSGNTAGASVGSFQYAVSDGRGGSATGTVLIDVKTVTSNSNTGDTVDLSGAGNYQASYIDANNGPDTVLGGTPGDNFFGGSGNAIDVLRGASGNDFLAGDGGNDDLFGGAGNDILRGGSGDDVIDGGDGNEDMLDMSDGGALTNFTLVQSVNATSTAGAGGLGNDSYKNMEGVIGSASNDIINGSSGNDIIRGGAGNDTLDGKGGNDLLDFSDATAAITFTMGINGAGAFSAAGLGNDTYAGFEGVIGTAFADTLTGAVAAEELRGGAGNDTINGQAGDDRIVGGAGADTLTGGADNDTFVFDTAPNAVDSIMDFNASGSPASGDMIELSLAVFAGLATTAGNALSSSEFALSSGGGVAEVVAASVRVIYDSVTGNLYYDSDGQGASGRTLVAKLVLTDPADTFDYNDIKIGS